MTGLGFSKEERWTCLAGCSLRVESLADGLADSLFAA